MQFNAKNFNPDRAPVRLLKADPNYGREVSRTAYCLAKARGDAMGAEAVAANKGWVTQMDYFAKAAVLEVDRTSGAGLVPYYNDLDNVLRAGTIVGRMSQARLLPFQVRAITGASGSQGNFVGEGQPAPVSEMALTAADPLLPNKAVAVSIVSSELIEVGIQGTNTFLANDVTAGVRLSLDRVFIDYANVRTAISPGSILQGTLRIDEAKTVAGIKAAVRALVANVTSGEHDLSTAVFVMSPTLVTFMSTEPNDFPGVTATGGQLCGIPILVSTACRPASSPGEEILALVQQDAVAVALSDAELSVSEAGAVQLSTTPTAGEQQLVSLWANNLVGFKTQVFADWRLRYSNGAAYAVLN